MAALRLYCKLAKTAVLQSPQPGAEQASELLFGEAVEVLERSSGWLHVSVARDGYTGWVADMALAVGENAASSISAYRISHPSGLVFAHPDIKAPLLQRLYMGSPVFASEPDGDFHALAGGGFIHRRHIMPQTAVEVDPVIIAQAFSSAPYLWGGRTCDGIDCSALVQTALQACGIACPRDTGDQRIAFADNAITGEPRRGDLVFFPGHVGIMVDAINLLHANAFWMTTLAEPLAAVVDRFQPAVPSPIVAVVRPI